VPHSKDQEVQTLFWIAPLKAMGVLLVRDHEEGWGQSQIFLNQKGRAQVLVTRIP